MKFENIMNSLINCLDKNNYEYIKSYNDSIFLNIQYEKEEIFNIKTYDLHNALMSKGVNTIIKLLEEGYDPNEYMLGTGSPLNYAINYKRVECILPLLLFGADANFFDSNRGRKCWHVLDDFYCQMQSDLFLLYRLFEYGSNPYLAQEKHQSFLLPHFWKFVKSKAIELLLALPHLSAVELIAILEEMYPAAYQIPYCKKWALVKTKHLFGS